MTEFRTVPCPKVEDPDLEAVRQLAIEMSLHMHFHEIAMAEPFRAERHVHEWGRRLLDLVGWPDGWVSYEPIEDSEPKP